MAVGVGCEEGRGGVAGERGWRNIMQWSVGENSGQGLVVANSLVIVARGL